jgi:hypothetical protein
LQELERDAAATVDLSDQHLVRQALGKMQVTPGGILPLSSSKSFKNVPLAFLPISIDSTSTYNFKLILCVALGQLLPHKWSNLTSSTE